MQVPENNLYKRFKNHGNIFQFFLNNHDSAPTSLFLLDEGEGPAGYALAERLQAGPARANGQIRAEEEKDEQTLLQY